MILSKEQLLYKKYELFYKRLATAAVNACWLGLITKNQEKKLILKAFYDRKNIELSNDSKFNQIIKRKWVNLKYMASPNFNNKKIFKYWSNRFLYKNIRRRILPSLHKRHIFRKFKSIKLGSPDYFIGKEKFIKFRIRRRRKKKKILFLKKLKFNLCVINFI